MSGMREKYVSFGLVRDKATGKPKVDNPDQLHPIQIMMMSLDERAELGLWTGAFARDAEGFKKVTEIGEARFRAEETLVAVSEIFADSKRWYRVNGRVDVPAGIELKIEMEAA